MMECRDIKEWIGTWCDGELPQAESVDFCQHIEGCTDCARDLRAHEELFGQLAALDPARDASAPPALWPAIEARLNAVPARKHQRRPELWRFFQKPVALAASIALLVGTVSTTVYVLFGTEQVVQASSIDYTVLLDGLSDRVDSAIEKFLTHYHAQPIPAAETPRAAPALSFAVPSELPGGFVLRQAYRLKFGDAPGVAAVYDHGAEPLVVFFHPTMDSENSGKYRERPCIVGKRHGHEVQVGPWRLMHFMDRTTCHCVLTRLDPGSSDLSNIIRLIAPDYRPSSAHSH